MRHKGLPFPIGSFIVHTIAMLYYWNEDLKSHWFGQIILRDFDMPLENAINIYTDGSSFSKPRSGGIGIRVVIINSSGLEEYEDFPLPGYAGATNNQMELTACIEGLKIAMHRNDFDSFYHVAIYSDSQYVVDNQQRAFFIWPRNKWRNYQGKPIENATLWKELLSTIKKCRKRVDFYWVKGHAEDQHNKAADKLARQSGKIAINPPLTIVKVRRKLSANSVEPGCIPMRNQRISIRIITDEYLRLQKCFKFKYEVISKRSPCFGSIDFAFSKIIMNAGHCYSIRFNDNQNNPTIAKVFKELPKK